MSESIGLSELKREVSTLRAFGQVKRFPPELRQSCLLLVEELGFVRVAKELKLSRSTLSQWRSEAAIKQQASQKPEVTVSRLTLPSQHQQFRIQLSLSLWGFHLDLRRG